MYGVDDFPHINPGSFFQALPLPVHEVLEYTALGLSSSQTGHTSSLSTRIGVGLWSANLTSHSSLGPPAVSEGTHET